ncbi:hypothetical protein E3N88_32358 [Mikania micrantha]|uniref:Uncharacterized protein n=1 Tax=Mikania micrantha TaxID=192012 RepID=A0A5N6M880_9ASTR|nr:hypothetical protein E3N88_32358 [Mikania micrantha]
MLYSMSSTLMGLRCRVKGSPHVFMHPNYLGKGFLFALMIEFISRWGMVTDNARMWGVEFDYEMGDKGQRYSVDDALAAVGFGKFQILVLGYAGMGWISEAMEMMLLSFVGPALESAWNLSSHEEI